MIFPAATDKEFALTPFKDKTACNVFDPICDSSYATLQPLNTYNYVLQYDTGSAWVTVSGWNAFWLQTSPTLALVMSGSV